MEQFISHEETDQFLPRESLIQERETVKIKKKPMSPPLMLISRAVCGVLYLSYLLFQSIQETRKIFKMEIPYNDFVQAGVFGSKKPKQ